MSKRSRRRLARDADKTRSPSETVRASLSSSSRGDKWGGEVGEAKARPSRLRSRLKFKVILIAFLIGAAGLLIVKLKNTPKPGTIEYSSDDPDAQVILEKDGEEIPLKQGSKYSMPLQPGYYTTHLVAPAKDLKLRPSFINLDQNGRAFVTVRREPQEPGETPTK